ncbi:hypothetical protein [Streptomyces sp. NPDC059593]|uniref:hypothetical protein n=1 Tax=Streptomyces sp. NPDC059593 TaxID=3346878 RepID=UPI00369D51A9
MHRHASAALSLAALVTLAMSGCAKDGSAPAPSGSAPATAGKCRSQAGTRFHQTARPASLAVCGRDGGRDG